jgi:centromere/kinetochore protein ZW10
LSRENTFDADDWIIQAKQLHADIERSRLTAREIVAQHEHTEPLQAKVDDAKAKVALVETEIAFNEAVAGTLEEMQRLCQQLETGRVALRNGQITTAIEHLESTHAAVGKDAFFTNTNVMGILSEEVSLLRSEIVEALQKRWADQLEIDRPRGEFQVSEAGEETLENTIVSLARLEILTSANEKFQKEFFSAIINPILLPRPDGTSQGVVVTKTGIQIEPEASTATASETLDRLSSVLGYLKQSLPTSVSTALSDSFIPKLSSKTISEWLSRAIPTDLDGLADFENILDHVLEFTQRIESWGWTGQEELVSWVNQAPRLWLTRRRVDSLDSVRKVLAASQGTTKKVERIEKEKVSQADGALLENAIHDDWDADWDDDKEDSTPEKLEAPKSEDEEEDVSAWGLDDDETEETQKDATPDLTAPTEEDDADDAWGWGDDDDDGQKPDGAPSNSQKTATANPTNKKNVAGTASPKEVTLKEVFTITDIPESVLQVVQQQIADSKDISQPA